MVAEEAKAQVRNVMDDARVMVDEQSRTQRDRLVDTARTFGDDLEQMAANGPSGMAGDVARQVAQKAREVSARLDGREPSDILEDVRDFARRRPGTFLLGAAAAGVLFGRLARGAKDAQGSTPSTASTGGQRAEGSSGDLTSTGFTGPSAVMAGEDAVQSSPVTGVPPVAPSTTAQPGLGDPTLSDTPLGDDAQRRVL